MAFHRTVKSSRRPTVGQRKRPLKLLKGLSSLAWREGTILLVPASENRTEGLLLLLGLLLCRSLFLGLALLGLLCLFLRCHSLPPRNLVHPTSPSLHWQAPPPPHMLVLYPMSRRVVNEEMPFWKTF